MAIQARMFDFPANGGSCPGYLAEPGTPGNKPGIVVIQEWWGLEEHIKDVADRFANEGFVAIAPDLYHGKVATEPDEARKLVMELELDTAITEIRGAVATLLARPDVKSVGTIGYCMGGRLSFLSACRIPDVAASVVMYGGAPDEADLQQIEVPVLALYAEDDPNITPNVPAVSAAMAGNGKSFTYNIYPGTKHAFFNDRHQEVYNAAAAADSWKWALRFLRANLS